MIKKIFDTNAQEIGQLEYTLAGDEAQIIDIFIREDQRRKGYARQALQEFIAGLRGFSYVILEVRQGNCPAIGLYRQLGFREIDQRRDYYKNPQENALVMKLDLL
jgi:ribosomal-protein-alanine N-acetyltransferase